MSSPASVKDHPIHPMLVPLPIGLFLFSLISDIVFMANGDTVWISIAYYTMLGGIIGGLLAAAAGFIDFNAITDAKTKVTATKHMIANLVVVALFVVSFVIRSNRPEDRDMGLPFIFSLLGIVVMFYSGWLGGDMVYEHGMAVELEPDGRLKKGRPKPYAEKIPAQKPKARVVEQKAK